MIHRPCRCLFVTFFLCAVSGVLLCAPGTPPSASPPAKTIPDDLPENDPDRIFRLTLDSAAMGRPMPYIVKLPRRSRFKNRRWPAVYLLHGWQGDENQMLRVNAGMATKHSLILVQPSMEGEGGWFDSTIDPRRKYISMLLYEIVPAVEKKFPVIQDRLARAITGFSMGGQGALRAVIRRPDLFAVAGATSGIFDLTRHDGKYGMKAMLGSPERVREYRRLSVAYGLDHRLPAIQKRMPLRLFLECPTGDIALPDNLLLADRLRRLGVDFEHDLTHEGEHSREYYATRIDGHLGWIVRQFGELTADRADGRGSESGLQVMDSRSGTLVSP